jgi:hypothetical protein
VVVHGPKYEEGTLNLKQFEPHLSMEKKVWVQKQVRIGLSAQQVMQAHRESCDVSNPSCRDDFLTIMDVWNLARKVASTAWMLDNDEANSIRMFVEQNQGSVFIYEEERPASNGQPPQPFLLGFMTPTMHGNAIKSGNNKAVLMDATFGTNILKMPMYTGHVVDKFGNGMPIFHVLTQSSSQVAQEKWMSALQQHMHVVTLLLTHFKVLCSANQHWHVVTLLYAASQGDMGTGHARLLVLLACEKSMVEEPAQQVQEEGPMCDPTLPQYQQDHADDEEPPGE